MDAKALFAAAVREADSCIKRVELAQMANATPCSEWNLRALLGHIVYEISWTPDVLAGKTITEVDDAYDGDLLGSDPIAAWHTAMEKALAAVKAADAHATMHLSYGDVPAEHYIRENGTDMLIHGWDVGQAIGCPLRFDRQVAQAVYDFVSPRAEEFAASGLFGKRISVLADASIQTKLLAFFGREQQ